MLPTSAIIALARPSEWTHRPRTGSVSTSRATISFTQVTARLDAIFREEGQRECHGNRTANARRNLGKWHHAHAIGGRQNCHVPRPALTCTAGGHDTGL